MSVGMAVPTTLPAHGGEEEPERRRVPRLPLPAQLQHTGKGLIISIL
jgi:hypothetical protein